MTWHRCRRGWGGHLMMILQKPMSRILCNIAHNSLNDRGPFRFSVEEVAAQFPAHQHQAEMTRER
jgi:hypothetical protein